MNYFWEGKLKSGHQDGEGTQTYNNGHKFSGTWKNGLKTGQGVYECANIKFLVKIKQGKLYKCLEMLSPVCYEGISLQIIQPNYTKQGEFYTETSYHSKVYLHCCKQKPLFDGRFQSNPDIRIQSSNGISIFYVDDCGIKETEIQTKFFSYFGFCLGLAPVGIGKFRLHTGICLKGRIKGVWCYGEWTAKNTDYVLSYSKADGKVEGPVKCVTRKTNVETFIYQDSSGVLNIYEENASKLKDIFSFISLSYNEIMNLMNYLYHFTNFNRTILNEINVNKNWQSLELMLKNNPSLHRDKPDNTEIKFHGFSEKKYVQLDQKEVYTGYIENGSANGIGKYRYKDRKVYVGEFKNNLKHGLGVLRFTDMSYFRGYFINDKMHGPGIYKCSGYKVIGKWENNILKDIHNFIYY